jgi:hypothetical protein
VVGELGLLPARLRVAQQVQPPAHRSRYRRW